MKAHRNEVKTKQLAEPLPMDNLMETKLNEVSARIDKLVDIVTGVVEMVKQKEEPVPTKGPSLDVRAKTPEDDNFSQAAPRAWRLIVNKILGSDVSLRVEDTVHGDYVLYFALPKHLDRRVGEDKNNGQSNDVSTGIIRRASAMADVEKWSNLVKDNVTKKFKDFVPTI